MSYLHYLIAWVYYWLFVCTKAVAHAFRGLNWNQFPELGNAVLDNASARSKLLYLKLEHRWFKFKLVAMKLIFHS